MAEAVIERVIKGSGGAVALAERLGITPQAVHKWRKEGIPLDRVIDLEAISGVPREQMCPEFFTRTPSTVARRKRA